MLNYFKYVCTHTHTHTHTHVKSVSQKEETSERTIDLKPNSMVHYS